MQSAGFVSPDEFWARVDASDDEVRRTFAERPIYGVVGWRGRAILSEWSFGSGIRSIAFLPAGWNDDDYTVASAQPRVDVLGDLIDPRRLIAQRVAFDFLPREGEPPWPLPNAPTPDAIVEIAVDGVGEPFEVWSSTEGARAAGRVGGVTVVVETVGHPIADVALERVRNIETLLAERRRWIRAQRGEA